MPRDIAVLPMPALACASISKVPNLVDVLTIIYEMHPTPSQRFSLCCIVWACGTLVWSQHWSSLRLKASIREDTQVQGIACLLRKQYTWICSPYTCTRAPESHDAILIFLCSCWHSAAQIVCLPCGAPSGTVYSVSHPGLARFVTMMWNGINILMSFIRRAGGIWSDGN
jgi:hypothetical protein